MARDGNRGDACMWHGQEDGEAATRFVALNSAGTRHREPQSTIQTESTQNKQQKCAGEHLRVDPLS